MQWLFCRTTDVGPEKRRRIFYINVTRDKVDALHEFVHAVSTQKSVGIFVVKALTRKGRDNS